MTRPVARLAALAALLSGAAAAQPPVSIGNDAPADDGGPPVRSVRIVGAAGTTVPFEPCARMTAQFQSQLNAAVLKATRLPEDDRPGQHGTIGVRYLSWGILPVAGGDKAACGEGAVDVELRLLRVRLYLDDIGSNVLPIARGIAQRAEVPLPRALDVLDNFNPGGEMRYDRAQGMVTAAGLSVPTAMLPGKSSVRVNAAAPLKGGFHDVDVATDTRIARDSGLISEYRLRLALHDRIAAAGNDKVASHAQAMGGGLSFRLPDATKLAWDMAWRAQRDEAGGTAATDAGGPVWSNRLMLDHLSGSSTAFVRGALWQERRSGESRAVAALGASRDIRLGEGRLLGLEGQLTMGEATASTTAAQRFRAGSWPSQFLYDAAQSSTSLAMPDGPLLRSAGNARLDIPGPARGGSRFVGASFNVALPVQRWFRPLIPDEVDDTSDPPVTLKQRVMRQIDVTAPNMAAVNLQQQGLSPEAARAEAQAMIDEIRPAARFLVEDAPIIAVRPLLMLDYARLDDGAGSAHWLAAGLGLQAQIVTARFELGFMHQLRGPKTDSRNSLVFRLVFQNLF